MRSKIGLPEILLGALLVSIIGIGVIPKDDEEKKPLRNAFVVIAAGVGVTFAVAMGIGFTKQIKGELSKLK